MDDKIKTNCPKCSREIFIPIGKISKFQCPHCNSIFEYDWKNNISKIKKPDYSWILGYIIIAAVVYGGYKLFDSNLFSGRKKNTDTEKEASKKENKANDTTGAAKFKSLVNDLLADRNRNNKFKAKTTANITEEDNLKILINAVDIDSAITNDYAVRLASQYDFASGPYNLLQVCSIYDYLVNKWKYVNDPAKREVFRSASRSIRNNLAGDCDDFAILMAAMIDGIGGEARISLAYNDTSGHAFTEVYAAPNKKSFQTLVNQICALYSVKEIHSTTGKDGKIWLNLDWWGTPQHPGGKYFEYKKRTIYYPTADKPYYEKE